MPSAKRARVRIAHRPGPVEVAASHPGPVGVAASAVHVQAPVVAADLAVRVRQVADSAAHVRRAADSAVRGRAPETARSLIVPLTASSPIEPPGKRIGLTT